MSAKVRIFCSYAHEDSGLQDQLRKHLAALQDLIESWNDHAIQPGDNWENEISEHLEQADIILLLISVDFLVSQYCMGVEMARALERAKRGEAVVIPVLLRPVDCDNAPFRHLQFLPSSRRPVVKWETPDDAFLDIEQGVRRVVEKLRQRKVLAPVAKIANDGPDLLPLEQDRMLDAAMAARVPMGKPTDLAVMVRRVASAGLKGILEITGEYSGRPEDVRSKPFRIEFPADEWGRPKPASLTLYLESPDFDPPSQKKKLPVPADADSEVCTFLLTPLFTGELVVNLEIYAPAGQMASRMFRVVSEASDRVLVKGRMLVSVPISTVAAEAPRAYEAAAAATQATPSPRIPPPPVERPRREAVSLGAAGTFETPPPLPPSALPPVRASAPYAMQPPSGPSRQQTVAGPTASMPAPQASAAPPKRKNFMGPLATAAAVLLMVTVGSVYWGNRAPAGSATLPSVSTQAPTSVPTRNPEPGRVSDPLAATLPGAYNLYFANLVNVLQLRGTLEISRVKDDLFGFRMALAGYSGAMPFRHQYTGYIEKLAGTWYVNTTHTTDPTIRIGSVQTDVSFQNNILTFRANSGLIMEWRKQ